jgi:hypothetical protein
MGSMSFEFKTATKGWQYQDANQFCNMKITSIKQANIAGSNKQKMPQIPTEPIFKNNASSDSCPQSFIETETKQEQLFREFIASKLPQYKASQALLAKIRSTIHQERLRTNSTEK